MHIIIPLPQCKYKYAYTHVHVCSRPYQSTCTCTWSHITGERETHSRLERCAYSLGLVVEEGGASDFESLSCPGAVLIWESEARGSLVGGWGVLPRGDCISWEARAEDGCFASVREKGASMTH